uniref:ATP synthase subunit delta, chloroplastic n=1 Tax=Galaxaura rugosa TaxID=268570 RepID=A0A1G4NTB3_9FLOR|nr:ATP synthase CF1 subunit delta [Galaxaura rugosa]SCW21749.1 ATP synthase CF1 subunit delta [Galaxaura rugosa]
MSSKTFVNQLSSPYAEALLDLAKASNTLERINEDVNLVYQVLSQSNNLKTFLANPLINPKSKKETLQQLFSGQVSDSVLAFLLVLIDKKRITFLENILDRYIELFNLLESLITVKVISSIELTDEQQQQLINKIKDMTNNSQVKLELSVDSNLIAGFTLQIGSKVIDTSLSGQLKEIGYFLASGAK